MTFYQTPDPGEDSPETVYKPGNPGGNWTPEEIDSTRERLLKVALHCKLPSIAQKKIF